MSDRKRSREGDESISDELKQQDAPVIERRISYSYSSEEMVESFDKAMLTVFSELPDDVWEPIVLLPDTATATATAIATATADREIKKSKTVPSDNQAGEMFATLPTTCLLEISSYISTTFEILDMLRTCQRLYERKDEFDAHLIPIVKKSFALLPKQCHKVERRIEGGWPILVMFLAEVERTMYIAYGGYPVPPIHQALVGERVMVSLFGRHHYHHCFHVLSPHGCQLRMRQKIRPLFSFCFDNDRFVSPFVLLGDTCADNKPFDRTTMGDYNGVPFMAVDEEYRASDTTLCLGIPEVPHQRRRGVDIYDIVDFKGSVPCKPFSSPFGGNWPSLMASFCMGVCREAGSGSAHSPDWKAWSVAWLLERDLIPDGVATTTFLTRIPWKTIINLGDQGDDGEYGDGDEDAADTQNSLYPWDSLTIKQDTLNYLASVLPKKYTK